MKQKYFLKKIDILPYFKFFSFRILFYFILAQFIVKLVFELGMGMWWYKTSQTYQYILYSFIALDYVATSIQFARLKYIKAFSLIISGTFLILCVHGVIVGLINDNKLFKIFNDTVPLIVIALNVIRLQDEFKSAQKMEIERIMNFMFVVLLIIAVLGTVGMLAGLPTRPAPGDPLPEIFFSLFFAKLFSEKKLHIPTLLMGFVLLAFWADDFNRTKMLFLALGFSMIMLKYFWKNIILFLAVATVVIAAGAIFINIIPEDSKTARRLASAFSSNEYSNDASTGERDAEYRAIVSQQQQQGIFVSSFGFGHGAEYAVQLTHRYDYERSFAHYSWAWFKMRYGDFGYLYCLTVFLFFLWSVFVGFTKGSKWSIFLGFLSLVSLIYMYTYTNFIILTTGFCWCLRSSSFTKNSISKPVSRLSVSESN
ncbi:hypothetical protein [uncultured Roseibium sp.]|uniref:hypothetical protein n=1 Tax=uncultured Roseibium sp. TaxID=1936171 RepID=UPI0032180F10